jgi:hypothetical protein
MGTELGRSASYHVRISPLHVRLKCDVAGCWVLGRQQWNLLTTLDAL